MPRRYQSIRAWKLAEELAVAIYSQTKIFPAEELYGLVSQMRRASVSVVANIAEGASRASRREYLQFLFVARGSLAELRCCAHLAHRLGYLREDAYEQLDVMCDDVGKVLYGLMRSVRLDVGMEPAAAHRPQSEGNPDILLPVVGRQSSEVGNT